MAIIISQGKQARKMRCPNCECIFIPEKSDIVVEGPPYDPIVSIRCPSCGNKLTSYGNSANDLYDKFETR